MSATGRLRNIPLFGLVTLLTLATASLPSIAAGQALVGKACGGCGAPVGIAAQVGQCCPSCGARWGAEQNRYVSGSGSSASGDSFPQPFVNPWLQDYLRRRADRQSKMEVRAEYFRKWEEKEAEDRVWYREQAALATANFRAQDNPERQERRAAQYLACAHDCEGDGDFRAAIAYYKLITRCVPDSPSAETAENALGHLAPLE